MADDEVSDFRKGMQLLDLTKTLRWILEQYPDDGQILKELIQNADDAGASTIRFVLDERQHSTDIDGLIHPDLAKFQGPALLAYNDAIFTKEDWDAIGRMQESIKRDDVIKTGRFGLGFKSIFHKTDLPMILSGDFVGVMDPHEVYLPNNKSSWNWHLENDIDFIESNKKQFQPLYHKLFESSSDELKNNSFYNHTLFRFPLRNEASRLSDTLYSATKIEQLFQSLTQDQGKSLLFLKNIQCIEIYKYQQEAEEPELVYSMKIAGESAKQVIQNRKAFCEKVVQKNWTDSPIETVHSMEIEVMHMNSGQKTICKFDSLVYHRCYGDKRIQEVAEGLNVSPWVGIALPLTRSGHSKPSYNDPKGELFATLPLPLDGTERTGLPFHIHADFAMEQNRRHLWWPTKDQKGQKLQTSQLMWNQLLVNECIPAAVLAFFHKGLQTMRPSDLYNVLPNEDLVDVKWKPLVSHFYENMFQCDCLYSRANGGSWIKPENSFLTPEECSPELQELLENILIKAGCPIVQPPEHVKNAMKKYSLVQPKTASTADVQDALIKSTKEGMFEADNSSSLRLLEYFLKNGQPTHLLGLPILPLMSGKNTLFRKSNETDPIFMTSDSHPANLLPGLEHRILATDIGEELQGLILKLARKGSTQLKPLSFKDVMLNIPDVLPQSWMENDVVNWSPEDPNHPSKAWMEQIWDYIHRNQPKGKDWPLLAKIQLLPINGGRLCRFSVGERTVLNQKDNHVLPIGVCNFLSEAGIVVLSDTPEFVLRNMDLVHHFVHSPSCDGLIDALMSQSQQCGPQKLVEKLKYIWSSNPLLLKDFVSYIADAGINLLAKKKKTFLRSIPLFTCVEGVKKAWSVSLNEINVSAPLDPIPVPFPVPAIDVSFEKDRYVLESLGVSKYHTFSFDKLLKDTLIPAVKAGTYNTEQIDNLACYIMDNHQKILLKDKDIIESFACIPFLETGIGRRISPKNGYDPTSALIPHLLDESFFPHKKYQTKERLACLKKVGLRTASEVTRNTFLHIIRTISSQPKRAEYLIQLTKLLAENHPEVNWWEEVQGIPILSAMPTRPDDYPPSLPWAGSSLKHLLRPDEVCHAKFGKLVGSVLPVVDLDESTLAQLRVKTNPSLEDLVSQLKQITLHYSTKEKSRYLLLLDTIYETMADFSKRDIRNALNKFDVSSWVWAGNGFQTAGRMCLQPLDLDLAPYVFPIPPELENHKEFMRRVGVPESIQLSRVMKVITTKYENCESHPPDEVERDLQLLNNILILLCREGADDPLVPIRTNDDTKLQLVSASQCTVWDGSDIDDESKFIHRSVPQEVIDKLAIPSETQRMLDGEEFVLESFGQTEPLTSRLKSVLAGYTDGLAILKENIQNADDAGATEVKLIYDMRENRDYRNSLIDPNMASWQGPAMWIYNDAVFKDEDFDNIIKLNGATKLEKEDKIGAFGLGFNAVYNMTDVPAILSKDTLVMFDPHQAYLGKSRPGFRVNIKKEKKLLKNRPDQFAPWNGVCGCDLQSNTDNVTFNGTLFRLPLRGKKERFTSDISNLCYDRENMSELLQLIHDRGSDMLLFTQNVIKVTVCLIEEQNCSDSLEITNLFQIRKEPVQYLRKHGVEIDKPLAASTKDAKTQKFIKESSILKVSVENRGQHEIKTSMIIASILETATHYSKFINSPVVSEHSRKAHWLVTSCIQGPGRVATGSHIKQPAVAGVAVCLEKQMDSYVIKALDSPDSGSHGSYFSFLPLPVKCPLPFHINGTFILDPSRRHLLQKTEHDKTSSGGIWNKNLIEEVVCSAFMTMLEDIVPLTGPDSSINKLLPHNKEDDMISLLSVAFWTRIMHHAPRMPVLHSPSGLVSFQDAYFLDDTVMNKSGQIKRLITEVISAEFSGTPRTLVTLPNHLMDTLKSINSSMLRLKTITEEKFFLDFFLPKQTQLKLTPRGKETLLIEALHVKSVAVENALKSQQSIPVSEDGQQLAYPKDLIHPFGRAAKLYYEEDNRFPCLGRSSLTDSSYEKLCDLGMVKDDLKWEDILERSSSLTKAGPRVNIEFVNDFLDYVKWKLPTKHQDVPRHVRQKIRNEKFLPPAEKPKDWKLKWKGEDSPSFSAVEIYHIKDPLLACTQLPILNENIWISHDVMKFLGIKGEGNGYNLPVETLRDHVLELTSDKKNLKSASVRKSLEKVQKHLNRECNDEVKAEKVRRIFSDIPVVYVRNHLLKANACAFKLNFDAFPYLNEIPRKYEVFLKAVGVRETFSCSDYIFAVSRVKQDYGDKPLPQTALWQVGKMLENVHMLLGKGNPAGIDNTSSKTPVFIPDSKGILQPASCLCYYDYPLIQTKVQFPLVHESIRADIAKSLGVEGLQRQALSERSCSIAQEKGEDLLCEIHSALEACSSGDQVLKELIKDADAAGAKEIHLILDPRTHRDIRVFGEGWRHLQGPALCVHHDAQVTEPSMKAMFGLGTCNKVSSMKQHQNVGFNSVYHFTDTPTLLATFADGNKALGVVDPTCQYVPGTSTQEPAKLYKDVEALRQLFPDVFTCYHEKTYKGGNLFRLPLRSPNAAQQSKISRAVKTCQEVENMLNNLSKEGFESLLFLTSVRKIVITKVNVSTGNFETETIAAEVSEGSQKEIDEFRKHLYPQRQTQQYFDTDRKIAYSLTISGPGRKEIWSVVQQCSVVGNTQDMVVGGVAYMSDIPTGSGKMYCSTKMAQKIDLPVHIYGNFSIECKDQRPLHISKKEKWNRRVVDKVVAAYLTLILKERERVKLFYPSDRHYYKMFPFAKEEVQSSDHRKGMDMPELLENRVVRKLYKELSTEEVILTHSKENKPKWERPSDVCFHTTLSTVKHEKVITGANLCGFEFAHCRTKVLAMLDKFGSHKLKYFSPAVLVEFLRTSEKCNWQPLAEKVDSSDSVKKATEATGMDMVTAMIRFCLQDDTFKSSLHQVPLLVTSDGKLNMFNKYNPVYKGPDTKLLNPQSNRFLHPELNDMFEKIESPVFKEFGLKEFCEELTRFLPDSLCQGEPVAWDETKEISLPWLEQVWEFINRVIGEEEDSHHSLHLDRHTLNQSQLLKYGGSLCILPVCKQNERFLFPLNKMHTVFEKDPKRTLDYHRYAIPKEFYSKVEEKECPICDLCGEYSAAYKLLVRWSKPEAVLKALNYHYHRNNSLTDLFRDNQVQQYLSVHLEKLLDARNVNLIKELPLFETLTGDYTALAYGAYVIPSSVPMDDMDSWRRADMEIIFLRAKENLRRLYEAVGCKWWDEPELYVEYIFPQMELLSDEGHRVHMDYVFEHLRGSSKVMEELSKIECVKNRAGSYCQPCDLYDPTVPIFVAMHGDTELAADTDDRLEVWRKAGMKHVATKEMLLQYAQQIAFLGTKTFDYKSKLILEYVQNFRDKALQEEYLLSLADIPFIPRESSLNAAISPEYTQEQFVRLKGSVINTQERLVWTVAPLVSKEHLNFDREILDAAGVISEPSCGMVAHNIQRVTQHCSREPLSSTFKRGHMTRVVATCFTYIAKKVENEQLSPDETKQLQDILGDESCVPVARGERFVKPWQTVLEAQSGEEVQPYIYQLPDSLAYSKSVLMLLGLSEAPTVRTYQMALSLLFSKVGRKPMTDEADITAATCATKQIFDKIKHDKTVDTENDLWLLSADKCLSKAQDILISNSFVLEGRLKSKSNILMPDLVVGSVEAVLDCFPEPHRPKLLTSVVKEVVAHVRRIQGEAPNRLEVHFSSEITLSSIRRVGHHILTGRSEYSPERLRQISQAIQNIKIRVVEKVKTCVTNEESDVVGTFKEKLVFVDNSSSVFNIDQRALEPGPNQVYAYKVLADMISDVSGGLFREYIGVLMVILSEEAEKLSSRLDDMLIPPFEPAM